MRTRYSLMDALSVEVMLGTDQTTSTQDTYSTRVARSSPDGSGAERRTETTYYVAEGLLQYNKAFAGGQHRINATGGFTWESQRSERLSISAAGFVRSEERRVGKGCGGKV